MTPILRSVALLLLAPLLGACLLLEPVPTPQPIPTRSPSPVPTVATPSPTARPSAAPTPGPDDVPAIAVGQTAVTAAGGLRLRTRPGLDRLVTSVLGPEVGVLVGLGPVFIDGNGWYLVRDPDRLAPPRFGEGWVAAGFEPDPFLVSAEVDVRRNPYLVGFAGAAGGSFGPVRLPDANVAIRWIAASLTEDECRFSVDLDPADGGPVPAIRATVGSGVAAPGDLFSSFFDDHPELIGTDLRVIVDSTCSWALSFVTVPARPSPSPD